MLLVAAYASTIMDFAAVVRSTAESGGDYRTTPGGSSNKNQSGGRNESIANATTAKEVTIMNELDLVVLTRDMRSLG